QRQEAVADRLFRGQGNASGRGRADVAGVPKATRPPRGLILSTGEEVPSGHSLRARAWIVEVGPNDVDFSALGTAQQSAAQALYARAMAGYLSWLASRMPTAGQGLIGTVGELRR